MDGKRRCDVHGDTFGMNCGQVSVFEEGDKVSLSSFLESHNSGRLETKIGLWWSVHNQSRLHADQRIHTYLEVLSNFTNEPLEGELPDEELGGLLVTTDFTKSDRSRAETMRLLYTTSSGLSTTE